MSRLTSKREEILRLQQALLLAMYEQAPQAKDCELPPQESWPSTRQLAEALNIGIYRTRYLLLDMVKKNQVLVSDCQESKSLRWFPTGNYADDDLIF